jgi:hypothetical protein
LVVPPRTPPAIGMLIDRRRPLRGMNGLSTVL